MLYLVHLLCFGAIRDWIAEATQPVVLVCTVVSCAVDEGAMQHGFSDRGKVPAAVRSNRTENIVVSVACSHAECLSVVIHLFIFGDRAHGTYVGVWNITPRKFL